MLDRASLDGRTPLWIASHNGHVDVVKFLIEQKPANPADRPPIDLEHVVPAARNQQRFGGGTAALDVARLRGHAEVAVELEAAIARARAAKARGRLKKGQQLTRAAVRMRDAEGIFFGPGKLEGEVGRTTRELGREEGIDYMAGGGPAFQAGGYDNDAPVELHTPRQTKPKRKKKLHV